MSAVIVDLQRRVAELEETVRVLEKDKEALYDDLESRLIHGDGSFWSSSSVVADRLSQAEKDRTRLQTELQRITAERDSFREDNAQIQAAKRDTDQISKSEMEKNHALERELMFYKKQCAHALEERNLFSYEVEELKRGNLELEKQVESVNGELEIALTEKEEVEHEREHAVLKIQRLEERLVECERIPELESQLQSAKADQIELQTQHNKLKSLYRVLQEDMEGAWQMVDQLKEEKGTLQQELQDLLKTSASTIETEKSRNAHLERRLEETSVKLSRCTSELRDADSRVAAAQAQAELYKECRRQEMDEARNEAHNTIAQLKIQLEETEGLLTRKMTEVQAAVEAKVTALENASEWESKCLALTQKLTEVEKLKDKNEKTSILRRSSLEVGSFRSSKNERQSWFRVRSRPSGDSVRSTESNSESLSATLDLVLGLVPKLRSIYESLETAEPRQTGSRRESLSRLDAVRTKTTDLQKELESYPTSPHLDDSAGRLSAHVTVGMEAVHLAFYSIARLKQFINVAH